MLDEDSSSKNNNNNNNSSSSSSSNNQDVSYNWTDCRVFDESLRNRKCLIDVLHKLISTPVLATEASALKLISEVGETIAQLTGFHDPAYDCKHYSNLHTEIIILANMCPNKNKTIHDGNSTPTGALNNALKDAVNNIFGGKSIVVLKNANWICLRKCEKDSEEECSHGQAGCVDICSLRRGEFDILRIANSIFLETLRVAGFKVCHIFCLSNQALLVNMPTHSTGDTLDKDFLDEIHYGKCSFTNDFGFPLHFFPHAKFFTCKIKFFSSVFNRLVKSSAGSEHPLYWTKCHSSNISNLNGRLLSKLCVSIADAIVSSDMVPEDSNNIACTLYEDARATMSTKTCFAGPWEDRHSCIDPAMHDLIMEEMHKQHIEYGNPNLSMLSIYLSYHIYLSMLSIYLSIYHIYRRPRPFVQAMRECALAA